MLNLDRINDYLTSDEATQLLGCSKRTLRRYVSQGLVAKVGKGRNTKYSLESVVYLSTSKEGGKLDKILSQLLHISTTQQLILTRLDLLESIFYSGSKVTLSPIEVKSVKSELTNLLSFDTIPFSICKDWSSDLLKLSKPSLKSIGHPLVLKCIDRLIICAQASPELEKSPHKRVVVDRLRWVKSSVE